MEGFVELQEFPGYFINREGVVTSKRTKKPMSPLQREGYYRVRICDKDGAYRYASIHRLLGQTFIPNPENKPVIDHIDRDTTNNSLENLRWATYSENKHNQGATITNKLQEKNIYINPRGYYAVVFKEDGKNILNTAYKTLEEAIKVRDKFMENKVKPTEKIDKNTNEKHIRLEGAKYCVVYQHTRHGRYATLEEAIKKRDEILDGK